MAFDLFGYNGVFELDQSVINKLLATFLYEQHLVEVNGKLTDGDFFSVVVPLQQGELHLYLELARPFVHVQTSDGSDLVTLHVPFSAVGVFVTFNGQVQANPTLPPFELVLFNVVVGRADSALIIDLSQLTADDVGIEILSGKLFQPGPTGVGGQQGPGLPLLLPDNALDVKDSNGNTIISGHDLRAKLADFLKQGAIGPTTVPLSPGGVESALASWDLLLFGNANDKDINDSPGDAGADILLFQDPQHGRGLRLQAGQTLPPAPQDPQYGWTLSLSSDVLLPDINSALDLSPYWVQGGTANTPDNPYGYLVVPTKVAPLTYKLPGGGTATVPLPQGGQVQVHITDGALTPNARGHVTNLQRHEQTNFTANALGGATLTVRADQGEGLAITVDAISLSGNSSVVIWRPQFSFQEGQITLDFHYYYYIKNWCDAEGDATVRIALFADVTKPFSIGVKVLDANGSTPWWAYVVAWLGPGLVGLDAFAPILIALVPTIMHLVAGSLIGGDTNALANALTGHISVPSPQNLAMVLDEVDVHQSGVQFSGRADSGSILAYGRQAAYSTNTGVVVSTTAPAAVYMGFNWQPNIGTIAVTSPVRWAVMADKPRETFWNSSYDDLPGDASFGRDSFAISAGDVVMTWVELGDSHAKVLFERPPDADAPSTGIIVTWIVYRDRVHRAVKLVNNLKATVVGAAESVVLEEKFYRYDGTISLKTQKFFLSDETQAMGHEQWFWDDQPITELGISLPGGTVTLDSANRELVVHLDQSGLFGAQDIASIHWVRFDGIDVFGDKLESKLLVQTFPVTITPKPIALKTPFGLGFIPPGDPMLDRSALVAALTGGLSSRLGPLEAASLANAIGDALTIGQGVIDRSGASGIIRLIR